VALYTPKLSRKPRTVAMIMKADTAKRFSLHEHILFCCMHLLLLPLLYLLMLMPVSVYIRGKLRIAC
jgi:hypothetical protein